jgi:hypothetical protein
MPATAHPLPPEVRRLRMERIRVSQRLAAGLSPAAVARAERLSAARVEELLAEDGFAELIAAGRAMQALPAAAQLMRLKGMALAVLERALADEDVRVALFFMSELSHGRDPALSVAKAVIAAQARLGRLPAAAPRPAPKPRPAQASDPHAALMARTRSALREAMAEEEAALVRADAPSPRPAPADATEPHPGPHPASPAEQWLTHQRSGP